MELFDKLTNKQVTDLFKSKVQDHHKLYLDRQPDGVQYEILFHQSVKKYFKDVNYYGKQQAGKDITIDGLDISLKTSRNTSKTLNTITSYRTTKHSWSEKTNYIQQRHEDIILPLLWERTEYTNYIQYDYQIAYISRDDIPFNKLSKEWNGNKQIIDDIKITITPSASDQVTYIIPKHYFKTVMEFNIKLEKNNNNE